MSAKPAGQHWKKRSNWDGYLIREKLVAIFFNSRNGSAPAPYGGQRSDHNGGTKTWLPFPLLPETISFRRIDWQDSDFPGLEIGCFEPGDVFSRLTLPVELLIKAQRSCSRCPRCAKAPVIETERL